MTNRMIVVVGAGPGVGGSVARRYGREGYDVALLGLEEDVLTRLGTELQDAGVTTGWTAVDVTDPVATSEAIARFAEHSGRIDVLHFNPSAYRPKDPLRLTVPELLDDVALGVGALLTAVQAALPGVQVSPVPLGEDQHLKESVYVGRAESSFDWRCIGPRRSNRSEDVTLTVHVNVYGEGPSQKSVATARLARADEILEAIEHAVRMARLHTGRAKVLTTYRSYHGATANAIVMTGEPRRWASDANVSGFVHFWGPYLYRSPFHATTEAEECQRALEHLENTIVFEGAATVAAVVAIRRRRYRISRASRTRRPDA